MSHRQSAQFTPEALKELTTESDGDLDTSGRGGHAVL
jgi:hypothetical protein